MPTIYDILLNFHEIFYGKGKSARQVALKTIMNAKMSEETFIRDHMICIIEHFNEMEIFKANLIGES